MTPSDFEAHEELHAELAKLRAEIVKAKKTAKEEREAWLWDLCDDCATGGAPEDW